MRRVILILVFILLASSLAAGVLALSPGDITFVRAVFSGGGEPAVGTGLVLNGTLGEPIASSLQLDTEYGLSSGFWQSFPPVRVYLPLVQRDA